MTYLAGLLFWLGLVGYGGPVLAFAFLMPFAPRGRGLDPWHVDRAFRALGPFLGLSMGALFAGGLARHYLRFDGFFWGVGSAEATFTLLQHLVFLVLWVSYTVLEVWLMEPLRQQDPERDPPQDPRSYLRARQRVVRTVLAQAALVVLFLVLTLAAGA